MLELNWYKQHGNRDGKKMNFYVLSSRRSQNKSFDVVHRTRTVSKCTKMQKARAKRVKLFGFLRMQIYDDLDNVVIVIA